MTTPTYHRTVAVNRPKIFYREAGHKDAPVVLLLHGFPTSSHQYRRLIDRLSYKYRVIAPDLPGFGFSDSPAAKDFGYTFDHLAEVIESLTDVLALTRYALYVFDYGAPVGFRLAVAHPERVAALISQNGNVYEEGLSDGWNPIQAYWQNPTEENRSNLRVFLQSGTTQFQYTHGEPDVALIAPESYTLDQHFLDRPGNDEIQLDLFGDYKANVAALPEVSGVSPHPSSSNACCMGKERSVLSAPGRSSFPQGHSGRRSASDRCRPLSARDSSQ